MFTILAVPRRSVVSLMLPVVLLAAVASIFIASRVTGDENEIFFFADDARAQLATLDEPLLVWPDTDEFVVTVFIEQPDGSYTISYQSSDGVSNFQLTFVPLERMPFDVDTLTAADLDALAPRAIAVDATGVPGVVRREVIEQRQEYVRGRRAFYAKIMQQFEQEDAQVEHMLIWNERKWQIILSGDASSIDLRSLAERLVWQDEVRP
nr:hypothetical protein [Ardenticatena sp.]